MERCAWNALHIFSVPKVVLKVLPEKVCLSLANVAKRSKDESIFRLSLLLQNYEEF
jgi:hypothetical protein